MDVIEQRIIDEDTVSNYIASPGGSVIEFLCRGDLLAAILAARSSGYDPTLQRGEDRIETPIDQRIIEMANAA